MNFSARPSSFRKRCGGFTLLEMMITLMIFILLVAAVFGIVSGVLQGSSTLLDNQNRRDQIAALNAYLKKQFGDMSPQTSMASFLSVEDERSVENGIVLINPNRAVALDAHLQSNGYYTLRFCRYPLADGANAPASLQLFTHAITTEDPSIVWIPLIHDIKSTGWKFQILNLTDWADHWNDLSQKPNLVEFSMQLAGDLKPVTMDFWIPRLDPAQLNTAALAANGNSTILNSAGNTAGTVPTVGQPTIPGAAPQ